MISENSFLLVRCEDLITLVKDRPGHDRRYADVTMYKMVIRAFGRNRIEVAGVRECIKIDDLVPACSHSAAEVAAIP